MSKVKVGDLIVIHHDVGYSDKLTELLTANTQIVIGVEGSAAKVRVMYPHSGSDDGFSSWHVSSPFYTIVKTQELH